MKKIAIRTGLVILFSLVGYLIFDFMIPWPIQSETPGYSIKDYHFVSDQNIVVQWDTKDKADLSAYKNPQEYDLIGYSKKYITVENYKLKDDVVSFNRNYAKLGEYWTIDVYEVKNKKLEQRTLDVFQLVRNYNKNLVPTNNTGSLIYFYQNKYYLKITVKEKDAELGKHLVLLDLETEKIVGNSFEEVSSSIRTQANDFYHRTSLGEKLGVSIGSTNINEMEFINGGPTDIELAKKDPQAYHLLTQPGSLFYLLTNKTDLKLATETYQHFLPQGQSIFDNLTIYGKYSVDGQDHVVNSYEEFLKYYKQGENS